MKIKIISLLILLQIAKSQVVLSFKNSCECTQIAVDTECNLLYPYCNWQVNEQNVGSCETTNCYNLDSSADCVLLRNCIWNGKQCLSTYSDVQCNQLEGEKDLTCQQQNVSCYGITGQCLSISELPSCKTYQSQIECTIGQEGKCSWSTTTNQCGFYVTCEQIPLNICNTYRPYETNYSQGQYCHINNSGQCVQMTCSDITSQINCTFVQTVFNQDQFYLCQWNSLSKTCELAPSTSNLTEKNCFSDTIGTYHWIAENKYAVQGICFPCSLRIIKQSELCLCEQLVSQLDCIYAKTCTWQQNKCITSQCSQFNEQQSLCAQSPACMYIFGKGCIPFTKCSDIRGNNQFQCIAQSLQCPSSNGQYCTSLPIDSSIFCQQQGNAYNCSNVLIGNGKCYWNSQKNECQYSSSCYSFNMQDCQKLKHACYYSGSYCYPIYCSYFSTASDCTFYFDYYSGSYKYCYWNYQYGYCDDQKPYELDFQSCYTSTQGKYRWSSQDSKIGACTQCAAIIVPNKRNWCSCDQLIYQGDCATAYDSCLWNPEKSQCVPLDCSMLTTRNLCVQNYNCHWIQYQNVMQCLPFTSCDKLPGSNSYMCMLYSQRCTQTDGKYCKELSYTDIKQKCSSIADYTNCYLTVASDGVCRWNTQTQTCYALSECSQITEMSFCGINNYACYWNFQTNTCTSLTCSMVTTSSECTYFDQYINFGFQIQMCLWNTTCQNATSTNLTSSNCFTNTAKTYRWSKNNQTDGSCQSCSQSTIFTLGFIILISLTQ
ncbi:unnamed protein product [Paramecium pentaurelia]|uniref:Uncharacterized protein n=1 Tax=Paramecium pentaurelia TaxID=43138 RepID=A0A8S1T3Q9_9CILI|nr:unnamed protein product [Paramecium pentaurelia]